MQFGSISIDDSPGAILAHAVRAGDRLLRKGHVVSPADAADLARAGHRSVMAARLDSGDIEENAAAARIAHACAGPGVRIGTAATGRSNLYATAHGVVLIAEQTVAALNAIHESMTLATLRPFAHVQPKEMLATVKIIPFAAPRAAVEAAEDLRAHGPAVRVAAFEPKSVALISTMLPNTSAALLDKSRGAVDARIAALGSKIVFERRVAHDVSAIASALREAIAAHTDPVLIFGASAITDRFDTIPTGIVAAGGRIEHFGMPVDPGNLLLLGRIDETIVIGLPGCARSPKLNGFDFVLERVLANIPAGRNEIVAMGVGGLLQEIRTRPQARDNQPAETRSRAIAAIVLAAGLSSRMGRNKLLVNVGGKPLVRRVVETALASGAGRVIVVTGNDAENVMASLSNLPIVFAHNPHFHAGLSTSLKAGVKALPEDVDGALILLGDMPAVTPTLINTLIGKFEPDEDRAICVPTYNGKQGNPVLWSRHFFPDILALEGDVGAKHLIAENDDVVCQVATSDEAPLVDIDTQQALDAYLERAE